MFWPVRLNWRNSVLIFHFDPLVKLVRSAWFALRGAGSFLNLFRGTLYGTRFIHDKNKAFGVEKTFL